jgi:DNA end-binding protein Ku
VRPLDGRLHMAMLNYDEEIKTPAEVLPRPKRAAGAAKQVKLAQALIDAWYSEEFDFSAYDDNYRERLQRLLAAKTKGHRVVALEGEDELEVINLMDALKQSMKQSRSGRGAKKPRKRKRPA